MKKIMIAVDDSIYTTNAIKYAAMISSVMEDVSYILFHVQPILNEYMLEEAKKDPAINQKLEAMLERNNEAAQKILEKIKERMTDLKIPEEKISLLTQQRQLGLAKDIVYRACQDNFDAVIIGRRGLTALQELFVGSTTKDVAGINSCTPVWIVDGQINSNKILLAVDGSENSIRATDYLLDMINNNAQIDVTLFHVEPSLKDYCEIDFNSLDGDLKTHQEDQKEISKLMKKDYLKCTNNFMAHVNKRIEDLNIPKDKLKIKTKSTILKVGKAINEELENDDYGTVVVGSRGFNKSFFMESVSDYLLANVEGRALWIIP